MQINNSVYQPNFQKIRMSSSVRTELSKRMKAGKFSNELAGYEERYQNSPVDIIVGFADINNKRLDAIISYNNEKLGSVCRYLEESKIAKFFKYSPMNFLRKVICEADAIEETYGLRNIKY